MTTTTTSRKATGQIYGLKSLGGLDGNDPGTFEAIVAVFGNVDFAGDRIIAGAFTRSLLEWKASGDPIPTIFSHQWDNLDAHIGEVLEAEELLPGDVRLPAAIRALGGLLVKFRLDLSEDFASRVAKRLEKRTIKEFSFAYDVRDERRGSDGANELVDLDLIEVGPTLKGMNPATALLARARKALGEAGAGLSDEALLERLAVSIVDAPATGTKAWVTLTGSAEELQEAVFEAAHAWALDGNIGDGGFYACYLEATFRDRVVVLVEGWNDPCGEGLYYELDFAFDGAEASVSNPREVGLETSTVAKARAMKHRTRPGSTPKADAPDTVSGQHDETGKGEGNGEDPEDPDSRTGSEGEDEATTSVASAEVDAALLEAGLDPATAPDQDPEEEPEP